jgi:hypothetical protein
MLGIDIDVDRRRVVERSHVSDRHLYTQLLETLDGMVKLRPGGTLREK